MSNAWVMGFAVAVVLVIIIAVVIVIIKQIRGKNKAQFDERQLLARNKAFKYSFIVTLIYAVVCMFTNIFELKWAPAFIQFGLLPIIGATIFAVICIFNDAYISMNYKKNIYVYAIGVTAMGVIYLLNYTLHISKAESNLFTSGTLSDDSLFLFSALMFVVIGISLIIKKTIDRKASENE